MLNAMITEDENPGIERLVNMLSQVSKEANIKAILNSVKEGAAYITCQPESATIFNETQLSQGLSFVIFNHAGVQIPVIFIRGHTDYPLMTFENNGIGCPAKPK